MLNNTSSRESIQVMFQNMSVLRNYARRCILDDGELDSKEETDRLDRLEEFFNIGYDLNWTPKEVTALLLREIFANG